MGEFEYLMLLQDDSKARNPVIKVTINTMSYNETEITYIRFHLKGGPEAIGSLNMTTLDIGTNK